VSGPSLAAKPTEVRIERLLAVPPSVVYAAWTDASLMGRWMSPRGRAEVTLQAVVGGRLEVVMIDGSTRIEHHGEFLEVDPPRRLRFTWRSPYTGEVPSIVTVELAPAEGGTRLVLVHERLPDADAVASHAGGWTAILDRLAAVLSPVPHERR
jgi:uncharacterized protein YndB with AHSA1/START domain